MLDIVDFSFGMPVAGANFYNRREELETLVSRIGGINRGLRNDIAVIGPRRIGKSSLTMKLMEKLKNLKIYSVEIDCEGLTLPAFLKEYSNAVIENEIGQDLRRRFRETLKRGISATITMLSEILGNIRSIEIKSNSQLADFLSLRIEIERRSESELKGEVLYGLFSKTIELPENLGRKYAVLLDEFQETSSYGIFGRGDFHSLFRRAIQKQKNVCYVYTGSSIGMMDEIFGNPASPLSGNADILRLGPFDKAHSEDFIRKGLKRHGKEIEASALSKLSDGTGGFPAYLNWIGLKLLAVKKNDIAIEETEEILAEMLDPGSAIYQSIAKQLVKLGPKTRKTLSIISMGNVRPKDIQRESGAANVYVYLQRLQNYGLVKKEKGAFSLPDPVMAEGLKRGVF